MGSRYEGPMKLSKWPINSTTGFGPDYDESCLIDVESGPIHRQINLVCVMQEPTRLVLCPYCGLAQPVVRQCCVACGGYFEPLSRHATQIGMGPWFVRDPSHPFRPGCSYEVLRRRIEAGKIDATTVLRGPTTRQFWAVAMNVPGVAHLLGYCHACSQQVEPSLKVCLHCSAQFRSVPHRNEMGLLYPTAQRAAAAAGALERQVIDARQTLAGLQPADAPVAPPLPAATLPATDPLGDLAAHAALDDPTASARLRSLADAPVPGASTVHADRHLRLKRRRRAAVQKLASGVRDGAVRLSRLRPWHRIERISLVLIGLNAVMFVVLVVLATIWMGKP
jgi:hypothetical protein